MADDIQYGGSLLQLGQQYAPMSQGVPFVPSFGFEGTPLAKHPLLSMFVQPIVQQMMGGMGMSPMGLNDRNVYDTLQNQRFFQMQQQLQRSAAEVDKENWMRTMRGVAHMTGTPWGADQMRASRGVADAMAFASPMLNMIAPDLIDEMAGPRGSSAVMAGRMMMASRYRLDPVSGQMGMDAQAVAGMSKKLYEDMYSDANFKDMKGVSAGQLGQMYEQLASRGMIGGSTKTPYESIRTLDSQMLNDAAKRQGVAMTDPAKMSGSDMDKLLGDSAVSDKMRSLDTDKVKNSLKSYLDAVNAVRDVFGDMGKPNAPMMELIGALEAMTNGSVHQLQPGALNTMVRMTHQLAQNTGIGLDNAMMLQQHVSQRTAQMGLEPVFAVQATQGAMAYGAAYRSMGLAPAWGAMNPDQMMQMDANLRANASGSRAAQRAGLAVRLSETMGGFQQGSDAAKYIEGLQRAQETGADSWIDGAGKRRELNLSNDEFYGLMTGATLANGQKMSLGVGQIESMMNQKFANREYVQKYNLGDVVRRSQGRTDVRPWIGQQLQGFLAGQLADAGVDHEEARKAAAQVSAQVANQMMDMDPEDYRNTSKRNAVMGKAMGDSLKGTAAGKLLEGRMPGRTDQFYSATSEGFKGFLDEVIRLSPDFNYLGNSQNMFMAFNDRAQRSSSRIMQNERLTSQVRTSLAPLNRGTMLRRAMGYLQQVGEGDQDQLAGLVATALGGVKTSDIKGSIMPVMGEIKAEQAEIEKLQRALSNETDPVAREKLQTQFNDRVRSLDTLVGRATENLGRLGISDDMLSTNETNRALNLVDREGEFKEQIAVAAGMGDPAKRREAFAGFWKTDSGRLYNETVREQGGAASDVALKLLSSKASVDRFGVAGVNSAKNITEANRELMRLASMYTGGDMGKLQAGDFDPAMAEKERVALQGKVQAQLTARTSAVAEIARLQQVEGKAWGANAEDRQRLAKELGVDAGDVDLARKMDPSVLGKADNLRGLIDSKASPEKIKEAQAAMMAQFGSSATVDELMRAQGVYAKVRSRADDLTAIEHRPPDQVARDFLVKYGVNPGESEGERTSLNNLGRMLKTEPGQALYFGLTAGQDYLSKVAETGGVDKGKRGVEKVDAVYKDYQAVLKAKDADRSSAEKGFRDKYGLGKDDDYSQFQSAMQLQIETGFIRYGESGRGQRTDFALPRAEEMIGRRLAGGTLSGGDRSTKVEFPNGFEVSGRLKIENGEALLNANKTGENSAGRNHAVTSQGGH